MPTQILGERDAAGEHPGSLRQREVGFLRDLRNFRRLSVKQRHCLKQIADRVLRRCAGE